MPDISKYQGLVTSEHADKPNFIAVLLAFCQGFVDIGNIEGQIPMAYDLDVATGPQLDAVGMWVGISRVLTVQLQNVYFSWDSTAALGWDSGSWQGPYDPSTGLTSLPDDAYRTLIRTKIAANHWDGSVSGAQAIWNSVFSGLQTIILQDNQDMTMTIGFVGPALSAVQLALLTGGYFPLKPVGVRITSFVIPPDASAPLFAWDCNSTPLQGWDTGEWGQELPGY